MEGMTTSDVSLERLLRAIADPTRRRILQALKPKGGKAAKEKDTGLCASDIEARMHLSQPTISHHMAILEKVGLVETTKQSQWRWYRRNENAIRSFARRLRETL
jgi:ArsR family transcriptional regulator